MAKTITIEDLLTDPQPLEIRTGRRTKGKGKAQDEMLTVFIRRPSDIEMRMAREAANGARRRLRNDLNDPENEKHALLLREPLENADPEELRLIWINGRLVERASEVNFASLEDREYVPEPEGDIVTAEEQDEYENRMEKAEDGRTNAVVEAITSIRRDLQAEAEKIGLDDLVQAAMPAHIESLAQREFIDELSAQLCVRCTFLDKDFRKPFFKTAEQARRLRDEMPRVYQALVDSHNGLMLHTEPTLGN